jgi:uncharacterized protein (TIGR01777 family)
MRVALTGATGTLGGALTRELSARGDEVTVLSRGTNWPAPAREPAPADALRGRDAVVNLLGEPIDQRWSAAAKAEIRDSRVLGTRNLVAALGALPEAERPNVLVSQSGVGFYGARGDERVDESAGPGDDFVARLVADWEAEARAAERLGLRVVLTRTGIVLSAGGGALARMLPFFKAGVGGPAAGGLQYMPWVHVDDVTGAILFALDNQRVSGPLNVTAPQPVTNRDFSRALGRALRRPAVFPVPGFMLKLLYGEMSLVVTTGQRAVPKRLTELGYAFRRPDLEPALREAVGHS